MTIDIDPNYDLVIRMPRDAAVKISRLEAELAKEKQYNADYLAEAKKSWAAWEKGEAELQTLREAAQELVANAEFDGDISAVDTGDLKALQAALMEEMTLDQGR